MIAHNSESTRCAASQLDDKPVLLAICWPDFDNSAAGDRDSDGAADSALGSLMGGACATRRNDDDGCRNGPATPWNQPAHLRVSQDCLMVIGQPPPPLQKVLYGWKYADPARCLTTTAPSTGLRKMASWFYAAEVFGFPFVEESVQGKMQWQDAASRHYRRPDDWRRKLAENGRATRL